MEAEASACWDVVWVLLSVCNPLPPCCRPWNRNWIASAPEVSPDTHMLTSPYESELPLYHLAWLSLYQISRTCLSPPQDISNWNAELWLFVFMIQLDSHSSNLYLLISSVPYRLLIFIDLTMRVLKTKGLLLHSSSCRNLKKKYFGSKILHVAILKSGNSSLTNTPDA